MPRWGLKRGGGEREREREGGGGEDKRKDAWVSDKRVNKNTESGWWQEKRKRKKKDGWRGRSGRAEKKSKKLQIYSTNTSPDLASHDNYPLKKEKLNLQKWSNEKAKKCNFTKACCSRCSSLWVGVLWYWSAESVPQHNKGVKAEGSVHHQLKSKEEIPNLNLLFFFSEFLKDRGKGELENLVVAPG